LILGINGIRLIGKRSGVGRCIEAIIKCLAEIQHPFNDVRVYSPAPLDSDIAIPAPARSVVLQSSLPAAMWEQYVLPKAHPRDTVLLCPSYVAPLLTSAPTLLIHHGSYEGFPSAFPWLARNKARAIYALSAHRASVVSTVSEYSRRDMARFYRLDPGRIHVIPEGVDTRAFRPLEPGTVAQFRSKLRQPDRPFILYVGKPTERRNLANLIRAFARLKVSEGVPHQLLIVGADLPGDSPFRRVIETEGVASDIEIIGYTNHQELPAIYNAAEMLVYPSSYEGFGMPVLEAMACGTPVVALNNTAFPEFAGGVALLLDDARVETLLTGMRRVLADSGLRQRMHVDGPVRAAAYDWRIVTRQYLDLLIPLAESRLAQSRR
jgi:glycosyltransferase involved in cell wall biosynthesis